MLLLVLVLVPRIPADKRRAWTLGLGVAAVVTCVVFWSALPFALAAATFALAAPGEEHPGETGEASASAGVILAALATWRRSSSASSASTVDSRRPRVAETCWFCAAARTDVLLPCSRSTGRLASPCTP